MTEDFKIKVIATGSSGNCYLVSVGDESLLLECGVNWKEILKALNFNIRNIKGCLVSHHHKDHSKAIREVLKAGIPTALTRTTVSNLKRNSYHRVHVIDNMEFRFGKFRILPFECNHFNNDGSKCECYGFLIKHPKAGKLLFATDTYYIRYKFRDVEHILVECNYSEDALKYFSGYQYRVLKSHMSLETLRDSLKTWDLDKTKDITLIHMSEKHGDEDIFKMKIEKATGKKVNIAVPGLTIGG